jgi:hypothetical protein
MKTKIVVEEVLTYRREMVVDVPSEIDEEEFDSLLDVAQKKANRMGDIGSILDVLEQHDCKVVEYPDDDLGSPDSSEFEITDYADAE